jgi:hypothetical protein
LAPEQVVHTFRQLSRQVVWQAGNRHRPGSRPDLALFASRRSGSTMLMEAVGRADGVKWSDQPFALPSASAWQMRQLPIVHSGQLVALDEDEQALVVDYVEGLHAGRYHVNEQWRFWRPDFRFRSDRLFLKCTDAHGIAGWLHDRFGLDSIALFRHPIPQSLSCLQRGYRTRFTGFLRTKAFVEEHLDAGTEAFAWDVAGAGDPLRAHVLGWCLENLPLIAEVGRRDDWVLLTYEDVVTDRESTLRSLAAAFGLSPVDRMIDATARRSRSARSRRGDRERQRAIDTGDTEAMVASWRSRVDRETEADLMGIVERLGIDLYRRGEAVATPARRFPS